jgi:spore germination protein YaaH
MFDRAPKPLPLSTPLQILRHIGRHCLSRLLPAGATIALIASTGIAVASPAQAYAAGPDGTNGSSIQYQEAISHAGQPYSFEQGGVATVPFQPRPGDSSTVDGAAPIALPAGQGSGVAAPNVNSASPNVTANSLRREVFGFLPYWELSTTLDYDTLSTIAYFGIDLNQADGSLNRSGNGWNGWVSAQMTSVINTAHTHGTRVALTIESFAWDANGAAAQRTLLDSAQARLTAAQQIAAEVGRTGVDGVNLDFEPIASGEAANYVLFVRTLRTELDKVHPGYELTFCANGMPSSYDLTGLTNPGAADAVFIMGYDFRGGSPATTGSIDPLTSPTIYDLTNAVNAFKAKVPVSQIILGLPFYGHAWSTGPTTPTATPTVYAPPMNQYGAPAAVPYSTAATLAATKDAQHLGKFYDTTEQTAWTAYYGDYGGGAAWRELYFDDARALGVRLDAVDGWNLRGAGIWALGYDNNNGDGDLTNTIAGKLQTSTSPATYAPVSPTRILDSRVGNGLTGLFNSHVARTFQVTGRGGVPGDATAVTGNLTATAQSSSGYLYVGPVSMNNPTSSSLNFPVGDDRANGVTVAIGAGGTLSITFVGASAAANTHVIFDVTGYFVPDASGATYIPLTPSRILDTRSGNGLSGPFSSHVARTFGVTGRGGVPTNATAVTGNLTVTAQTSSGYLYLGPVAMNDPTSSTLNFPKGDDRANGVTVAIGTGGTLSITYVAPSAGPIAQVIFDVTGYFAS